MNPHHLQTGLASRSPGGVESSYHLFTHIYFIPDAEKHILRAFN